MKIRTGFVSNSSSSSFIIVVKKGELTKEALMKAFKVAKDSPLYNLAAMFAYVFVENSELATQKQILEDYGVENIDDGEVPKLIKKAFESKSKLYTGSVSSEGESEESCLCEMYLNYEDDNIIIQKDGGY